MITLEVNNGILSDISKQLLLAYNIIMFSELSDDYHVNMDTDLAWDYLPATGDKSGYAIGKLILSDGHELSLFTSLDTDLHIIDTAWRLSKDKISISISDTATASPLQELEIKSQITEPEKSVNKYDIDNQLSHLLFSDDNDDMFSQRLFNSTDEVFDVIPDTIPATFSTRSDFKNFMNSLAISLETAVMDCCDYFKSNDLHFAIPREGGEEVHLAFENGAIVRKYDDDRYDTFFLDLPYSEQVACVSRLLDIKEFGS